MTPQAIGVDIGGTHLRAAVVDANGTCHKQVKQRTDARTTDTLVAQIQAVLAPFDPNMPVGVAIAGLVDGNGTVHASPNLAGITFPFNLAEHLHRNALLTVENDASAAAYAEHVHGAARNSQSSLTVTIGTGVGAGIVLNDTLWRGANGFAGEVGHMLAASSHQSTPHTVEQMLSGTAIAAVGSRHAGRSVSAKDVVEAAQNGDTWAREVLAHTATVLGETLANLANMLDVKMCVIGGGAGVGLFPLVAPVATQTLTRHLLGTTNGRQPPRVVVATLGDDAGVVGAALLARERTQT